MHSFEVINGAVVAFATILPSLSRCIDVSFVDVVFVDVLFVDVVFVDVVFVDVLS